MKIRNIEKTNVIMKRMTQWVMTAALTFCGTMMMLTSCTDAIGTADNPVNPEPPYDPAGELAKETFIHESYMDRTVKPGDSFWHFALGSYLKQPDDLGTMMEAGFYQQAILMTVDEMKAYNSPNHAMQLLLEEKSSADDEKAVLDGVLARMKPGNDISKADMIRNIGKLADLGYCPLLGHDVMVVDGTWRYTIIPGLVCTEGLDSKTLEEVKEKIKSDFQNYLGIDTDSEEGARLLENVYEIEVWIHKYKREWMDSSPESAFIGCGRPVITSTPVRAMEALAKTRGLTLSDSDLTEAFREAFHIDGNTYYLPEVDRIFQLLDQYDTATLQTYLRYYTCANLCKAMFSLGKNHFDVYGAMAAQAKPIFLDYEKSVLYRNADCEGALQMLEDMRTLFKQHIENLDWLSDATKDKAIEKLQAMIFHLKPETNFYENFQMTGKTPVEDLVQYKEQLDVYLRNDLAGKNARENEWEYLLTSPNGSSLADMNAFYDPNTNELVILPLFLSDTFFSTDPDRPMRYATLLTFGHEMTHGFDNTGAAYDATGRKVDWWTADDKAKFLEKQQQMIDRYNELEQVPGVPANGQKTLGENIADLGGFTLAYEMWNAKLKADGLTGEALRHQQRQFILEVANFWKVSYPDSFLMTLLEIDPHSANHNRVNGVVRLIDDWYDLFGVMPGDKLYVAPADRVKIW